MGSLSLVRPDGELETVALWQLDFEPLFKCKDESGASIARSLMDNGEPVIYISGETSPVAEALDLASGKFTAMVAVPVKTHVRTLGLLCLYLPQESPAPKESTVPHLARLGQGLALALEVASGAIASDRLERMERATIMGQLAEQALMEIGMPVDRLFMALGQIRRRPDTPSWLTNELVGIGTDLALTKELRDGVLAFMAGRLPDKGMTSLEELMDRLRRDLAEPLRRAGIELKLTRQANAQAVRADGFLLRCALLALVEHSRNYLAGTQGRRNRDICASDDRGQDLLVRRGQLRRYSGKNKYRRRGRLPCLVTRQKSQRCPLCPDTDSGGAFSRSMADGGANRPGQ